MNASTKYALLFRPENINSQHFDDVFQLLVVEKSSNKLEINNYLLDEYAIKQLLFVKDKPIKDAINNLLEKNLKANYKSIQQSFKAYKNSKAIEQAVAKAYPRFLAEQLKCLLPKSGTPSISHYTTNTSNGKQQCITCTISASTPSIYFDVRKNEEADLAIHAIVMIDDVAYPITAFAQHQFLLEKNNEYFLLHIEDMQMINWLHSINIGNYFLKPDLLLEQVIKKLEVKYRVDRNDCFTANEIIEVPKSCIYISELSGMYLMLTPQWSYDGFVVDNPFQEKMQFTRNGKIYHIIRNAEYENELVNYLKELHPTFEKQNKGYYYVTFADAKKKNWFLNTYHQLLEKNIDIVGIDMLKHFRYSQHAIHTTFQLHASTQDHMENATMHIQFGNEAMKLIELQKIILANQKTILLKDDTIGLLPDEWLQEYGVILKHSKINKNEIQVPAWILISAQQKSDTTNTVAQSVNYQEEWQQAYVQWQNPNETLFTKPIAIKADLRIYQQKGFEWMALLSKIGAGACLADDMGLGKTLQTITYLAWQQQTNLQDKFLIICPASLIYNWKIEIEKFAPHFRVNVLNEENKNQTSFISKHIQVYIGSYGKVRSMLDKVQIVPWDVIVLDESHNIKNPNALSTKAVRTLQARHRIALSGTPVMNNTFDLYSQVNFLLPDLLGTPEFFRQQYANPIDREKNEEKVNQLKRITAPFILRRTKEQVAKDLPAKIEQIMWCQMSDAQQNFYDNLKAKVYDGIMADIEKNGLGKSKIGVLAGITKLRQACGAPVLVKEEGGEGIDSIKVQLLIEEIQENLASHKALVFSQFKGMLQLIKAELDKLGIAYYHFDGDTDLKERQNLVSKFQDRENTTSIFLISLMAGNAGITLTEADYVFLVDPWWNTAVQDQAIDRTHRIGQNKTVFAYKMICKNTIEEKIILMQQNKKELSDDLVSAEENFVKTMSVDDVKFLFGS